MIVAKIRGKVRFPVLNLDKELKYISDRIIIPLIQTGIHKSMDVEGRSLPHLETNTVRMKRKKGLPSPHQPLVAMGILRNSFKSRRGGMNRRTVYINDRRRDIARYLQIDGIRSRAGRKFFKFFGVTEGMEKDALLYLRTIIKRKLKNAGFRR